MNKEQMSLSPDVIDSNASSDVSSTVLELEGKRPAQSGPALRSVRESNNDSLHKGKERQLKRHTKWEVASR